ncbi:hypothetical protein FSP39_021875 [Pinctada imbricata]|uniref:Pectin acetylesterase n=1 Tax=Pinctada imbricata TaxID=66713 RepID=A0AA88Y681_PINIB|nr:hypothetical protein FSP39_021875 [Pinctada imbricata]
MGQTGKVTDVKATMTFVPVGSHNQRLQIYPPICGLRRLHIQLCFLAGFLVLLLIARTLSNMRVIFVQYHAASDTDGELVVLPKQFAVSRGAYCIDGSAPGYYIRRGKSPNVNGWILHLPGGSWCSSVEECYSRSFTELGSSVEAPMSRAFGGILSSNEVENPDFHKWNMVDFLYCDGGFFTGNRSSDIRHHSKILYLRGFQVFNAVIDYLLEHTELKYADQVILAGTSSGGVAATVNADYLRRKLTSVKSLHLVVDAGLFLDQPNSAGEHVIASVFKNVYYLHNILGATSISECSMRLADEEQWKCLLPSFFYKHLFTPVFFVNSLYDTWYMNHVLSVTCPVSQCKAKDIEVLENHKNLVLSDIHPVVSSVHDGLYLTSCPVHSMLVNSRFNTKFHEDGVELRKAFSKWFFHKVPNVTFVDNMKYTQVTALCVLGA